MTDEEPLDPLVGQVLAARYRVLRVLGEGGMGRVYLAEHVRMGRLSAVKVMSPALMPTADAVSRFNREASNASRINHPNVAAIYDFGEGETGTLYLAMEYVDGETLASLLRREGALSPSRVAGITRQIADALHAAHLLGIVHRDLKPDNVLVTTDAEGNELVKVVDFGIAKSVQAKGQTVTTAGVSIGTPEYMSPEQLAGESLDARSDIYSLGLVTFVMLTTELPYPEVTSKQSLVRRLTELPSTLAEVRPDIAWSPALQAALTRALSPDAHERYAKATEFAREVVTATRTGAVTGTGRTRPMTPLSSAVVPVAGPASIAAPAAVTAAAIIAPRGRATAPPPRGRGGLIAAGVVLVALAVGAVLYRRTVVVNPAPTVALRADTARALVADAAASPAMSAGQAVPAAASAAASSATTVPRDTSKLATVSRRTPTVPAVSRAAPGAVPSPPMSTAPKPLASAPVSVTPATPDSLAAAASVSDASSIAASISAHLARARGFAMDRHAGRATAEFRLAVENYLELRRTHPGDPATFAARQEVLMATREALAGCQVRDTMPLRGRSPCEPFARAAALVEGSGPVPSGFQGGRRRLRPGGRAP